MLRKILIVLTLGLVWLFIFSIPVDQERKIFDVGYSSLVDTKPMHWLVGKVLGYVDLTRGAAQETADKVLPEGLKKFSQAEGGREATP